MTSLVAEPRRPALAPPARGRGASSVTHVLFSERVGGAAAVAIKIAERLASNGRLAGVLVGGVGPAINDLRERGLSAGVFPRDEIMSRNRFSALFGNFRLGMKLSAWRKGLVHFHLPALYRAARFSLGRCQAVVHVQIEEPHDALQWAFKNPPPLIVPCAKFMEPGIRRALPARYQASQRIEPLPNAVDVDGLARVPGSDRRAAKLAVGAAANVPLVLMTANLAPHKGQTTAIAAVARLKALGVDVACWLAGEDRESRGYDRQLAQMAEGLGVADRVKLLGFRKDVGRLYAAADVLLLPSTSEGLPLTILEAQASGVPVLAAPTAGIPEIIENGKTGWLVAADDAEGYAERIKALVENDGLSRSIADQAFEYVRKNHNWDNYCSRMIELYDSLSS